MRNVFVLSLNLFILASVMGAENSSSNFYNFANSPVIQPYNWHTPVVPNTETRESTGSAKVFIGTKEKTDALTNTRSYTDGISELTTDTYTPLNIGVSTPAGQIVGSASIQKREFTETVWEFSTNDLHPEQNIFDERGRGLLVDGKLSCRITHRVTVSDYTMGGMSLGMMNKAIIPGVNLTFSAGATFEKLKNNYWESSQFCPVGPVPSYTTPEEIAKMCAPCHRAVAPTLKQDVKARMNALTYLVNTNLCKLDSDCEKAGYDGRIWTYGNVGRCVLVRDKNNSHYSECQTRSSEGRGCPGPGSYGGHEYECDKGLECVKVHEGKGFWNWSGRTDYSKYVCMKKKSS